MSRSKIKYWSILVFVLILTSSNQFLPKNLVYADSDESTQIDAISVKAEDRESVVESQKFFEMFMDDQSPKRSRSLGQDTFISPLSGKMIKLLMLNKDIVISILENEDINLDEASIAFESLTETNQIANFQEVDGEYILTNLEMTDSGTLSIDLDYVENYINDNKLDSEKVAYVRTGLRPDLAFVYSTETEEIIPFYKNIGDFIEIEGVRHGQIYKTEELRGPLQKYYDAIYTVVPEEGITKGSELFGAPSKSVLGNKDLSENLSINNSKYKLVRSIIITSLSMIATGIAILYTSNRKKLKQRKNKD
ncbi:hypothetical protein PT129_08800 [Erysipelothrix rhusiopathiae]|nr:hypothetical protein [Erysipelothrix rhusiopathiae]MDE8228343.1 hypothetical protein [Erysipelothrix rhusiopathiae]MDE8314689.1 hypothetical protein [Erysipelothrix rhusiopathiae]